MAERHLNPMFCEIVDSLSRLTETVLSVACGSETTKEELTKGHDSRSMLADDIRKSLTNISSTISQASAEIGFARFSVGDFDRMQKSCQGILTVLTALNTSFKSDIWLLIVSSEVFVHEIAPVLKGTKLIEECCGFLSEIRELLTKSARESNNKSYFHPLETAVECKKLQLNRNFELIGEVHDVEATLSKRTKDQWNMLLEVNFFLLATEEFAKELTALRAVIIANPHNNWRIHFNFQHFLPIKTAISFLSKHNHVDASAADEPHPLPLAARVRNVLLSPPSVYSLKSAAAITCLLMVMYNQPIFYQKWYLSGCLVTSLIAISPSLGQQYFFLPIQIFATSIGTAVGCAAVLAVGDPNFAILGFALIVGIPCFYLTVFQPKYLFLGLFTLIAFSNFCCNTFANKTNPNFDLPLVYLYKLISVSSVTLAFSIVFSLTLYPVFARHVLRKQLFEVFRDLNIYYRKIVVATVNSPEDSSIFLEEGHLVDSRNKVLTKLDGLDSLANFGSSEPRLEGRFPIEKYKDLISHMYTLLDRFECMRISGGGKPLDASIRKILNSRGIGELRFEMQQTIRLLLYTFGSTVLLKRRLPPHLPNARQARERFFDTLVKTIVGHAFYPDSLLAEIPSDPHGVIEALNEEKWVRLLSFSAGAREVSYELDQFGTIMQELFGLIPDIFPDASPWARASGIEGNDDADEEAAIAS
ncbi:hypothetical protein HDU83_003358 [Entophlyctis luteolus]|nr:hypothetical protein HDU83_003358 [Entophlyctis luteolus]